MKIKFNGENLNIGRADINMSPFQDIGEVEYVIFDFDRPGQFELSFEDDYNDMGIKENKRILLEIERTEKVSGKKFPVTFFGSQIPDESAHMYVTVNLID